MGPGVCRLTAFKPALVVEIRRDPGRSIDYFASRQLIDPQLKGRVAPGPPAVALFGDAAAAAFDALPAGPTRASFTVRLSPPVETDAPQRNVIGLLPGSDPKLADTYILVTAHYDGQGTRPGPDRVWNSASDNQALAVQGVPAHTVCVTFQYPDYHGAADTWQKVDYENMALTVRMIGTVFEQDDVTDRGFVLRFSVHRRPLLSKGRSTRR